MKKFVFLWMILATVMFACSDDDPKPEPQPGNEELIGNLEFPSQSGAIAPGSELTIKGDGFSEESKIYLRAEDNTETEAEVKSVTDADITIVIPELVGKFKVILKQDDKEQELGSIEIGTSVLVKNGMEIMPKKVKMIIYECTQRGNLDTIIYTTEADDMLKFTQRWSKSASPLASPHVYNFAYNGNLPSEVKHLHGNTRTDIGGEWDDDEDEYDETLSRTSSFDYDWEYDEVGTTLFTTYDSDNRLSRASVESTAWGGESKSLSCTYINGFLNKATLVNETYGETTETMFSVSTDGVLTSASQTTSYEGGEPRIKTINYTYAGEYMNSLNVDLFDLLFFEDLTFMSYEWSWGGVGENCVFALGIVGNRFKQLPTETSMIATGISGNDVEFKRKFEYYTNEGYITLINVSETEETIDFETGGTTQQTIQSSFKIIYEEE